MRVLVLSSHTVSLFWFRIDLMKEMVIRGYDVYAVGQLAESEWEQKFEEHGIHYRAIRVSRNGTNPFSDLAAKRSIKSLLSEIQPDKVFVYQAKTIAFGCQAAAELGITEVYPMVAGLGSVFRGDGIRNAIVKRILAYLYERAFKSSKRVFFQNKDDSKLLLDLGLLSESQIVMVNGSGVNLEKFAPVPLADKPSFLYIGRLIRDKGVTEFLEAAKKIKSLYGAGVDCLLVGPFDTNPSALNRKDLDPYLDAGIEFYGEQADVRPFLAKCSVFVLPSYHEGTPKTVLEAMSTARAIITTDVPGCRETVVDGLNGFLVPAKDVGTLSERMIRFIEHPELAVEMGKESRRIAEDRFDVRKVNDTILKTMGL